MNKISYTYWNIYKLFFKNNNRKRTKKEILKEIRHFLLHCESKFCTTFRFCNSPYEWIRVTAKELVPNPWFAEPSLPPSTFEFFTRLCSSLLRNLSMIFFSSFYACRLIYVYVFIYIFIYLFIYILHIYLYHVLPAYTSRLDCHIYNHIHVVVCILH